MRRSSFPLLAVPLFLAACGDAPGDAPAPPPQDPVVADALADPIMTDPDLSAQSGVDAAIAVPRPALDVLPPVDGGDAAIGGAKDAAGRLLDGTVPAVPEPSADDLGAFRQATSAAQVAVAAKVARPGCAVQATTTARWAALLPEALQPYPRGAVIDAAGTDAAGCGLRAVRYVTPVPPDAVIAFHYARLLAARQAGRHTAQGDDHLIAGRGYAVHVGKAKDGLTPVDIVVGG